MIKANARYTGEGWNSLGPVLLTDVIRYLDDKIINMYLCFVKENFIIHCTKFYKNNSFDIL